MDAEISLLEQQIEQLVGLYENLKGENRELRSRLAALEAEKRRLGAKVDTAAARIEAVLEQLPQA